MTTYCSLSDFLPHFKTQSYVKERDYVVLINGESMKFIKIARYCSLNKAPDGPIDPAKYKVALTDRSSTLVDRYWQGPRFPIPGSRIHINSRNGIYTVVRRKGMNVVITCNKWHGETREISIFNFRCYAGGFENAHVTPEMLIPDSEWLLKGTPWDTKLLEKGL